jgi:hypothetical protein
LHFLQDTKEFARILRFILVNFIWIFFFNIVLCFLVAVPQFLGGNELVTNDLFDFLDFGEAAFLGTVKNYFSIERNGLKTRRAVTI